MCEQFICATPCSSMKIQRQVTSITICAHFCTWAQDQHQVYNDLRESTFLFQRLAITLQRFNSVLLRQSFVCDPDK